MAFSEVIQLIGAAREKAIQAVNAALIDLYWEIGATISRKIELPSGAMALWIDSPSSSPEHNLAFVASVGLTYSE